MLSRSSFMATTSTIPGVSAWPVTSHYRPSARVILDQRVDGSGQLLVLPRDERSAAEADLMLSRKYGGPGRFDLRLAWYSEHGNEPQREAAEALRARQKRGSLAFAGSWCREGGIFLDGSFAVERFP